MAVDPKKTGPQDPAFITYLFTLKGFECQFLVGNKGVNEPERIGVVKDMLMAHSEVLRSDMLVQDIKEGKCISVTDLHPDTFRNLLRFMYGYDNTSSLCFEEADNLLYAAEKYMVEPLKARLAERLMMLLTPQNICALLNNPACYRLVELDSAIKKILHDETAKVLANPMFLDLSSDALTKVFEQETMNVPEIEIWRAAVKWARHRTNSDNGQDLRKALEGPAKYIRVCAIDNDSFVGEVYPAGILTEDELRLITFSKLQNKKQDDLIGMSNKIESRKNQSPCKYDISSSSSPACTDTSGCMYIVINECAIELLPLIFYLPYFDRLIPAGSTYELQCTITITRITDLFTDTSSESPQTVKVCKQVGYYEEFVVPMTRQGKNIVLLPNYKYRLQMNFSKPINIFYCTSKYVACNQYICDKRVSLEFMDRKQDDSRRWFYLTPVKSLVYQPTRLSTN